MKYKYFFPVLMSVILLLASCQGVPAGPIVVTTPSKEPTSLPPAPMPIEPTSPPAALTPVEPTAPSQLPSLPAVQKAVQFLAGQLGIPVSEITLVSYDPVDWPDGCLGIEIPGMACTAVIVPGYRVILQAGGQFYEIRTNLSGSQVALAGSPQPMLQPKELAPLVWKFSDAGGCNRAEIRLSEISYMPCDGSPALGYFASLDRQAQLSEFIDRYAPFTATTAAGEIEFSGSGPVTATPAEQRMLAEWARIVSQEAEAGRSGAAWGLTLDGRGRLDENAPVGDCQFVAIYRTGQALAGACSAEPETMQGPLQLTSYQLRQLYRWLDIFGAAESESGDVSVNFTGDGTEPPGDADLAEMQSFAKEIYLRASTPQDAGQIQLALDTLDSFLNLLAAGQYAEAADLYGGSLETLTAMNPDIPASDRASLFEAYCKFNGGVCNLGILNVVHRNQLGADRFRFTVELATPDGSLFSLGPCCGADPVENPPQTQFEFTVEQTEAGFKALDLPVYVP